MTALHERLLAQIARIESARDSLGLGAAGPSAIALLPLLREAAQSLQAQEGGEWVLVPRHYNANVAYAACVLEQSTCAIDRLNAPPLRTLEKALSAAPSPTTALQVGEV